MNIFEIFGEKFLIIGQGSGMILCMAELRAEPLVGGWQGWELSGKRRARPLQRYFCRDEYDIHF